MKAVPILVLGVALASAGAAGAQDRYGYQSSEPYAVRAAAAWRGGGGGGSDGGGGGGGSAVVSGHLDPHGTCVPDDGYGPPPSGPFCECPPTDVYEAPFYTPSGPTIVHVRAPGIRITGRPIDVPGSVVYVQGPPVWVDAPPVHVGPSQIYIQAPDVHVRPSDVTVAPPDVHFTPAPPPHTPVPCPDCTPSGHY